jgi:hypothetical protein
MTSGEVAHGVWRLGVGRSCVEKMKTMPRTGTHLARWLTDTKTVSSLVRCGLRSWASAHGRFFIYIFFYLFSLIFSISISISHLNFNLFCGLLNM